MSSSSVLHTRSFHYRADEVARGRNGWPYVLEENSKRAAAGDTERVRSGEVRSTLASNPLKYTERVSMAAMRSGELEEVEKECGIGKSLKSSGTHDEYIGGSVEYFDFVDLDKFGMIELWGFAEDLGLKDKDSIKFWHKVGGRFINGRCLESDLDVLNIKSNIPKNYEVEIYIVHLDASRSDLGGITNVSHCQIDGTNDEDDNEDDICADSEGLESHNDSDEEDEVKNYPQFDSKKESEDPKLSLGLIFSSKKEAKFAIQTYNIKKGKAIKFTKNDNIRLWANCKQDDCPWIIHVAKMSNDSCWQVRTLFGTHNNCFWDYTNKSINSTWLAKQFVKRFATNPKLGTKEFRKEVCTMLKANISRKVAYLAKRKALQLVQGTAEEQFSRIRNYCAELKRSDEGATVVLKLIENDQGPRFQRLYVCFSACKQGFKDACRPIIGIDGCFLKEKHGGQLLSAVGIDPNNNIFLICYALVERETKDSWTWFLRLLDSDIGFVNQHAWTFMSDKQKGLISAIEFLFPDAEHRLCVRHLHSNMKHDGFKSLAVKIALWAATKATRIEDFRQRMEELKNIDHNAYEWLAKKPEDQWSKSHFSTIPKSDILLNNMCESFNSCILDARDKPIIEMFESIRNLLMNRFLLNREKAEKWKSQICPKIRDLLAKISMDAAAYSPMKSDEMHYQITRSDDHLDQHSVDLSTRTCSCRKWDLTGIPCKHAVCAIWCKKDNPEAYVHHCYLTDTYRRCYALPIMPVNGPNLWPACDLPPPLPPFYKEKIGRPTKLRRREPDEPPTSSQKNATSQKNTAAQNNKLKGAKRCNKCRICGGSGHNQRTCKGNNDVHQWGAMPQEDNSQQSNALPDEAPTDLRDNTLAPSKKEKLQVRRPRQVGVCIQGSSYSISSINVNQSINIHKPAFVKDGTSFTTISRLRSYTDARCRMRPSLSSPVNFVLKPSSSQGSISKI
ncbi:hypothetical protein ZIOFF_022981 [Zingiber officinale]|uniref:SWIM-type domain-containing protein n=1 Tax=Zingiber officinale TaxID=94328 RepID=A0A8J5HF43_ZINOF|nr:hypothetical protein ZIOFF_022981 [Zingiber officinale]